MVEPRLFFLLLSLLLFGVWCQSSSNAPETVDLGWSNCGYLELPNGYQFSAESAGLLQVADTPVLSVSVSVTNGDLYCMCKVATADVKGLVRIVLSLPLHSATSPTMDHVEVTLSTPCSVNRLRCDKLGDEGGSHGTPLKVSSSALVRLVGKGEGSSWTNCKYQGTNPAGLKMEHGGNQEAAGVILGIEELKKWNVCYELQSSSLAVRSKIVSGLHEDIRIVQVFLLDAESCTVDTDSVASGHLVLTISQTPQLQSMLAANAIHASNNNHIHARGKDDIPMLRVAREADSSSAQSTLLHATVRENSPVGTVVATVQHVEGEGVATYAITGSSHNSPFIVHSTSGVVTTQGRINRETGDVYQLTLQATVAGTTQQQTYQYTISVLDDNDHAPVLQGGSHYSLNISEDTAVASIIEVFSVTDEDEGLNSVFHCTLLNNSDHTFFIATVSSSSSPATGCALSLSRPLDYEAQRGYRLVLLVQDCGTPALSSLAVVIVTVTNVADTTPTFSQSLFTIQVSENTSVNATIATLTATYSESPPLDHLQYRLLASADILSLFRVGMTSGDLIVIASLDYETFRTYEFWLQARPPSQPDLVAEARVIVHILDVNDRRPTFSREEHIVGVKVMQPAGTYVTIVTADDEDSGSSGKLTYSLSPATTPEASAAFTINVSTGVVSTLMPLDIGSFMLVVQAVDGGTPTLSSNISIAVDVVDTTVEPPRFTRSNFSIVISEGNEPRPFQLELSPETVQSDNLLRYSIQSGNRGGVFNMSQSGALQVIRRLDRELQPNYDLVVVVAMDVGGGTWLEGSSHVRVVVADINDNAPTFLASFYEVMVSEGLQEGTQLVQVMAVDRDEGTNAGIQYSINTSDADNPFVIDPESGWVELGVGQRLDYESSLLSPNHTYAIIVVATDGDGALALTSSVEMLVRVEDVNDNVPIFDHTHSSGVYEVAENSSVLTPVVQIVARDADSAQNSYLHYELVGDAFIHEVFMLTDCGWLYTTGEVDRETRDMYNLTVLAVDNGCPPLSTSTTISVRVTDVTDDPPVFLQDEYFVPITSKQVSMSVLTMVTTQSRDVSSAGICYSIVAGGNASLLFSVNSTTGAILAARDIDPVMDAGRYKLTVRADHLPMFATATVDIVVGSGPILSPVDIFLSLYLTLLPQSVLLTNISTPHHEPLTFSLLSSYPPGSYRYFKVQPSSGVLSVINSVQSGLYVLNISASDTSGMGVSSVSVHVSILDNTTLDNTVGVQFRGLTMEIFLQLHLEPFLAFVANITGTNEGDVEICGMDEFGSQGYSRWVELALAVKSPDILQSYFTPYQLRGLLLTLRERFPLRYYLSPVSCTSSNTCPNLQVCHPIFQVRATPTEISTIEFPGVVYHSSHTISAHHKCKCPLGYSTEDLCSSEIDECVTYTPCLSGAKCVDRVNGYSCVCPSGVAGKNCSILVSLGQTSSCGICNQDLCLYGGRCCARPSGYTCKGCPWAEGLSGPNCELVSVSFTTGSYIVLATPTSTTRFGMSLSFATISSSALLLYVGRQEAGQDYIAVEVLLGQVKVGVSFGGVATVLTTDSRERLNDGEWHDVVVEIQNRVVKVIVSNCSSNNQILIGAQYLCELQANLHSSDHRILDLTTPLYIGGLEPPYSTTYRPAPLTALSYDGCISNLTINDVLVDFNTPLRKSGVSHGCPSRTRRICAGLQRTCPGVCRDIWNGSSCHCTTCTIKTLEPSSSILFTLKSTYSLSQFTVHVRTRASDVALADFGGKASLALVDGVVMFVQDTLSIAVDANINDGLWHMIHVDLGNSFTMVIVDEGRASSSVPEQLILIASSLTIGPSSSTLCVSEVTLAIVRVLTDNGKNGDTVFMGVVTDGCQPPTNCSSCSCPASSTCIEKGWGNCSCSCSPLTVPLRGQCENPCSPNPCNSGDCFKDVTEEPYLTCRCAEPASGPTCADRGCGLGFFGSSSCQRCRCDPEGVANEVCDRSTGKCACKLGLDSYERTDVVSGDLGCIPCDCHPVGAVSASCDRASGQCSCRANVAGRKCDMCSDGTAVLDEQGCRAATVVEGSFTLVDTAYLPQFRALHSSPEGVALVTSLQNRLEGELFQFGLPGLFQTTIFTLSNRSGLVGVSFKTAAYLPRNSTQLLPAKDKLAAALQRLVWSGKVGGRQVDPTSLIITDCTVARESCSRCPSGLSVLSYCEATPTCGQGRDTDHDGYPDNCDSCPFVFNLDQSPSACREMVGVCPGGVADGILWSSTPEEANDLKLCPFPQLGLASRRCLKAGWSSVNPISCISVEGRGLLFEAEELEEGRQVVTVSAIDSLSEGLREFITGPSNLTGGDVQVAGRVLGGVVSWVESSLPYLNASGLEGSVAGLVEGASLLLNPDLEAEWRTEVAAAAFSSADFLFTLEGLSRVATSVGVVDSYSKPNLLIKKASWQPRGEEPSPLVLLELQQQKVSASVALGSGNVTPPSNLVYTLLPTLGQLLPHRADFNISHMTLATPIFSVQATDGMGSEVTGVSVNVTLGFTVTLPHMGVARNTTCVSWSYQGRGGWSVSGCKLLEANLTSVTCHCPHLTAFTSLLPIAAIQPPPTAGPIFHPLVFTYVVLCCVAVALLGAFLFLSCVYGVTDLATTPPRQLLLSVGVAVVLYLVAIDRTEIQVVCSIMGVVLVLVLLTPLSWLLADLLLLAKFLVDPPRKKTFAIYLYIIGWVFPAILCCISMVTVSVIKKSFHASFAYPNNCWLLPEVVLVYVAPAIFLLALYLLTLTFSIVTLCQDSSKSQIKLSKDKVRYAIGISVVTAVLVSLTLAAGLLAIYLTQALEYLFGVFYMITTVYLIAVHCFNKQVRESLQYKLKKKRTPSPAIDLTFPTTPAQAMQAEMRPRPLRHPANNDIPYQHHDTLTSVPSSTPSEFQRQLALLSHQPCYNNSVSQLAHAPSSIEMLHAPPHPAPTLNVSLPPSPPRFSIPEDHADKPWFEDSQLMSPVQDSDSQESSSSSDGSKTPPPVPPSLSVTDLDDAFVMPPHTPDVFFQPRPPLSQITERDEGEHEDSISLSSENLRPNHRLSGETDLKHGRNGSSEISDKLARENAMWKQQNAVAREAGDILVGGANPTSPVGYLEYTAQERSALMERKEEDPLWYSHRDSMVDNGGEEGEKERAQRLSYHRNTRPASETDMTTPLPYEAAMSSSLTTSCDTLDPMSKRPLPPSPPSDSPMEWWKSPSPSSSTFSSPPPGKRSSLRMRSTSPTKATSSSSSPVSKQAWLQQQRSLDVTAPPEPIQDWKEFQKLRYKRIQMKSSSEDRLDGPGHTPSSHITLLPGAAAFPYKRHNSVATPTNCAPSHPLIPHSTASPMNAASSQFHVPRTTHTPHSAKPPPPLATHPHLKRVQSAQPLGGTELLPQLMPNPMYQQRGSDTLPSLARHRQTDEKELAGQELGGSRTMQSLV